MLRLLLALLIAVTIGMTPVAAGMLKAGKTQTQECKGMVGKACPCDNGQARCDDAACKASCASSALVLPADFSVALGFWHVPMPFDGRGTALSATGGDPPIPRSLS
jgi:hypothetical protein